MEQLQVAVLRDELREQRIQYVQAMIEVRQARAQISSARRALAELIEAADALLASGGKRAERRWHRARAQAITALGREPIEE